MSESVAARRSISTLLVCAALLAVPASARAAGPQLAQAWVEGIGICNTQLGWCPLPYPDRTPLGVACYCVLPNGQYISGQTEGRRYYGLVHPYFNPHTTPNVPTTIK